MITIVDYGLGNIKAFANLYRKLNIDLHYASNPSDLASATRLILPGVGSFDHAMKMLNASGMRETLDELVLKKKVPVIGICVGMQMMADSSEEGQLKGLGWIPGTVKRFKRETQVLENQYPLPHMGWNSLEIVKMSELLAGLDEEKQFYFLHSYYYEPSDRAHVIASANYGLDYACIINNDNIYGIQCHPEKSHHNGITLLKNFASL
ncbi:imidazole glycerol phosphate synthase subunit HisH [Vibrio cholerae]|uniref:imidazole glycerol phosphate synthase subunit HisH n=1 Tax=Vibrio cholerae TaxID=666 RepID=UPI0005112B7F|nr:imidazole glycerol phosphate synthase subunit HisH [Vibrio cholerae]GHW84239.1 glutamine amidotransferase [Vibrio metoecus]EGQ7703492.1 imidazole glycerol phosphate synthase subunit HisH [Vibrio cholerae]EGQ7787771.1 imidazole glycerol phosphate synthase subunit HisH [Vibrio cholerae]EGQ9325616.1 imidazole glycerol phosphate synthase subunit HisH [Vibrio cholerae]EGQ9463983.1 imidazole glycerol phosphate synthase subunit HisH [Vibrio cholerae]